MKLVQCLITEVKIVVRTTRSKISCATAVTNKDWILISTLWKAENWLRKKKLTLCCFLQRARKSIPHAKYHSPTDGPRASGKHFRYLTMYIFS